MVLSLLGLIASCLVIHIPEKIRGIQEGAGVGHQFIVYGGGDSRINDSKK
jgi:hypothetical protein